MKLRYRYEFIALALSLSAAAHAQPNFYQLTDLGPGNAYAINDIGQVVGGNDLAGTATAYLWNPGGGRVEVANDVSFQGTAVAFDINNQGQVVGQQGCIGVDCGGGDIGFYWNAAT